MSLIGPQGLIARFKSKIRAFGFDFVMSDDV